MIAIRPRSILSVALVCLLALGVSGCGLSAELDREGNPERKPTPTQTLTVEIPTRAANPSPSGIPTHSPSVPVQEEQGCPPSGLRFRADAGDAAMGLRAMGLDVTNCGDRRYTLNGYPSVTVLDESGDPFPGVRTVQGTDEVSMAPEDPGPRQVTLDPGETAHAALYWRMHNQDGVYLRVAPEKGDDTVTVRPPNPLDIGPENILGTTAWQPSA
ncbi:DUF4232 domain-containing protein [Streptomyces sp. NBC_00878]|uniref:DUF4232 domain-containing protein n=1 Tax=Streptomyces sp. NBC_00878 TaxID=2975854 RepID=UPI00225930FB|nr:DUF4232 domain-containing protein [Streptomyces sp. NBC_00878]MCX4904194.1 DUF4232 domain-containing protein [Streptomyces sp. NBC_00878]